MADLQNRPKPTFVTRTRLPEFSEYSRLVEDIFNAGWLTNGGKYVCQLERELSAYLGCKFLTLCNNGTTALMLALHCAGLAGKKVAVTPFTYVATLSALLWLGCEPVFVDIDRNSLCLSPARLEDALAEETGIAAVLPVHIYGLACDDAAIAAICQKYGIPLIYDAAQAFASNYHGKSLLACGDYSVCSFHATKIFHCAEGGCVIAHSPEAKKQLNLVRAFGHVNDDHYCPGINAKLSEIHAAMGLCLLPGTAGEVAGRKKVHNLYDQALAGLPLERPVPLPGLDWNHAYYPVILPDEATLQVCLKALADKGIHPRRYFYPALTRLPYTRDRARPCPVAEDIASRVICLPLHGRMDEATVQRVAGVLRGEI